MVRCSVSLLWAEECVCYEEVVMPVYSEFWSAPIGCFPYQWSIFRMFSSFSGCLRICPLASVAHITMSFFLVSVGYLFDLAPAFFACFGPIAHIAGVWIWNYGVCSYFVLMRIVIILPLRCSTFPTYCPRFPFIAIAIPPMALSVSHFWLLGFVFNVVFWVASLLSLASPWYIIYIH